MMDQFDCLGNKPFFINENNSVNNVPFSKNRILDDPDQLFLHNAWDNACWTEEQIKTAHELVKNNSTITLNKEIIREYESSADIYWDEFYSTHQDNFFKDRKWLFYEFPELLSKTSSHINNTENQDTFPLYTYYFTSTKVVSKKMTDTYMKSCFNIFEVGCGVGNTIFPILNANIHLGTHVFGCDFSKKAISVLKSNPAYDASRCHVFVHDITADSSLPFPLESMDLIILVFVLSAIHPSKHESVIARLVTYLKPGGTISFRDYGRYDLAQLRFKKGKCLGDNFYVRSDGTRAYFFSQGELRELFGNKCGLSEIQNVVDKRIIVNRKKLLQMHRVWIQCKYSKSTPLRQDATLSCQNLQES